jgi:lactate racemase
MQEIKLPYGRSKLNFRILEERLEGVLISKADSYMVDEDEVELVKKTLSNPIKTTLLQELVAGKNKIVIISSDHTRPVPSHITMPILLEEVRKGNPEADITILVATGVHRASTEEELRDKYGDRIFDEEKIVVHDCSDSKNLVKLGLLPSGGELILNRLAIEADLLIAEGFIEPHFFAGFSGGRKSVLPGIASRETVLANHCAEFVGHERARTGIMEGSPMHEDMLFAARKAKLAFILNVVLDMDKKIINVFAGHWEEAHLQGSKFVSDLMRVKKKLAPIVITTNGGYPLDQNIYQSVKCMTAAEATCKENGVIIVVSECSDGHGGDSFFNTFAKSDSVQEVMDEIMARDRDETIPDQWESQVLARVLLKYQIIMVTDAPRGMVESMHMKWASTIEEAIKMAEEIVGEKEKITVIPDGISVIVE